MTAPRGTPTLWLLLGGLSAVVLAGCSSSDAEPDAAVTIGDAGEAPEAEEPPRADEQPSEAADDADAAEDTDDGQDAPEDDSTDDGTEAGADEGGTATEIEIGDFFFDDDQLEIEVGSTVTWTHQGDITHNVTARDESFVSDNLSSGDTFSHTFDAAGSFEYVCTLHGQMVADVAVS